MADNGGIIDSRHANPKYVLLKRDEVLEDTLAPVIITPNIRSETGEYLKPEAGHIVFKIIRKPKGSFSRIDSGLYTLDAMRRIVNWDGHRALYTPGLPQLYQPIVAMNEVQFMANTRLFGITTVRGFSDHQRGVPSVNVPVILHGRLELNSGLPRDSALKISQDEFVSGEEPVEWQEHVRMEVFLILSPGFKFRVLLTKFYDIETWFATPAGRQFIQSQKQEKKDGIHTLENDQCGFVRLGYHFDDRPQKRVVEVGRNGDRFLQKFIFKPGEWHLFTEELGSRFSVPLFELETGLGTALTQEFIVKFLRKNEEAVKTGDLPWYAVSESFLDRNDYDDGDSSSEE